MTRVAYTPKYIHSIFGRKAYVTQKINTCILEWYKFFTSLKPNKIHRMYLYLYFQWKINDLIKMDLKKLEIEYVM